MEKISNSDDYRTNKFSKYLRKFQVPHTLELERGETLEEVVIAYETYGEINSDKSNCILVCHAITGDSHVAKHDEDDLPGWWDIMVGPNKPIDTNGFKRMNEFCHVVFSSTLPEDYIIVGGHSIWFRSFFKEFLPRASIHDGKKKKIVNCGAVAFDLWKTTTVDGKSFMIDEKSIKVVYGGFK